ncbi:MAG: type II toxin-antitoxin system prevent-host-death family antitoxin [Anaerolineae bacterium]|nr:type II toxin-antitoxin system prevent-host-death family antitoxin [Anaerolineae bacterium]
MSKTMSATDARIHFGELMRHVTEHQEPVFVERAGKPQVVVISVAKYEQLTTQNNRPDWQETIYRVLALGQKIHEHAGDEPLTPPEEIIRQMREERSDHLQSLLP